MTCHKNARIAVLLAALGAADLRGATITWTNTSGGTLALPLTVTASRTLNMNGTTVSLYGAVTNTGTIHLSGSGRVVLYNNQIPHGIYAGAIYNEAGALFGLQTDQGVADGDYGSEVFVNAGTLRKSSGAGTSSIGVACTNSGTMDAESGTIQFSFGGNIGGTYNTAAGASIQFVAGTCTETGTVSVTGSGLCRQNGATVILRDRISMFVLAAGNVVLSPTFEGTGTIQNSIKDSGVIRLSSSRKTQPSSALWPVRRAVT